MLPVTPEWPRKTPDIGNRIDPRELVFGIDIDSGFQRRGLRKRSKIHHGKAGIPNGIAVKYRRSAGTAIMLHGPLGNLVFR